MAKKKRAKPTAKLTTKLATSEIAKEFKFASKKGEKKLGHYSFIMGVVLALIAGIFVPFTSVWAPGVVFALFILGFIVGLINIRVTETRDFLIASVALLLTGVANFTFIPVIGTVIQQMLSYLRNFVAPAVIIVAIIAIYKLAED